MLEFRINETGEIRELPFAANSADTLADMIGDDIVFLDGVTVYDEADDVFGIPAADFEGHLHELLQIDDMWFLLFAELFNESK